MLSPAGVAQLVEQRFCKSLAAGSSPASGSPKEVVEQVTQVDDALVRAMARLIPQLSPARPLPTREDLAALAREQTFLVARDGEEILGTLTLVLYRTMRLRARIEDVVVDEAARGRGVGESLVREALCR